MRHRLTPLGGQWRIAIEVPESKLNGPDQAIMRRTELLGGIVLLFAMCLSFWLASGIARPFLRVTRRLKDMAEVGKDLEPMPPATIREAGQLADSFEHMRTGLRSFSHGDDQPLRAGGGGCLDLRNGRRLLHGLGNPYSTRGPPQPESRPSTRSTAPES